MHLREPACMTNRTCVYEISYIIDLSHDYEYGPQVSSRKDASNDTYLITEVHAFIGQAYNNSHQELLEGLIPVQRDNPILASHTVNTILVPKAQ